ncbi:RNA polymerase factor sigma-54 [Leptospirillum ferrooxidans]|uniref:GIY-YIG domain-containing protein n=1 Tax=Leptospirillum ferrooxidans (strain C2-3) TaxID=1162668 RepID=I0IM12_LEPFC|nr:GIY-YIG nuclease family protein [Leptospirillum ferrooxidans]BAM06311.1 hypothetical protein LFE_0595 [Leptospirillum ferrooxidans C2-3]
MIPICKEKLDPALLGKIVVARFLELPLQRFDLFVQRLESELLTQRLSGVITIREIEGTKMGQNVDPEGKTIGEIGWEGNTPELLYHKKSYIRTYHFDDTDQEGILQKKEFQKMVQSFRLINTRNHLTYALIQYMLRYQATYLRASDPTLLRPLTQSQISFGLATGGFYSGIADSSRISRLIRTLFVKMPDNRIRDLSILSPSSREICCHFINRVIKLERSLMDEGKLLDPLTDGEIAERVGADFGSHLSRRTVAYIRRELGIPEGKERRQVRCYHVATAHFSPPMFLSTPILREVVPNEPGVYEIRSFVPGSHEGVIYIGSTRDLRKRLHHHLQGTGNNQRLREKIVRGARFRFRIVREHWRDEEREIYRTFCVTYGTPPECNRMSP